MLDLKGGGMMDQRRESQIERLYTSEMVKQVTEWYYTYPLELIRMVFPEVNMNLSSEPAYHFRYRLTFPGLPGMMEFHTSAPLEVVQGACSAALILRIASRN